MGVGKRSELFGAPQAKSTCRVCILESGIAAAARVTATARLWGLLHVSCENDAVSVEDVENFRGRVT